MDRAPNPPPDLDFRRAELAELGHWSAAMIHELRQPLFALQLRLQMAEIRGGLDPVALAQDVSHLIDLVEYFASFSRSAAPPRRLDLRAELGAVLRVIQQRAGRHAVTVRVELPDEPLEILARPVAVRQIAANLVHNALDAIAGSSDTTATLSAGRTEDVVWLRVADRGPGIPEDARDRIFDAWFTTKGQQGTGLGLYLARELARGDGGELVLESSDVGASFLTTWPIPG